MIFIFIIAIVVFIIIPMILAVSEEDSFLFLPFKKKNNYNNSMLKECLVRHYDGNIWASSYWKKLKDFPSISFSQFYDFYCLNPDSWCLYEYRVSKDNKNELSFIFEYDEWKKYDKWRKRIEEEKELAKVYELGRKIRQEKNEVARRILESVQRDIDVIKQESQKNIAEASKIVSNIKSEHINNIKSTENEYLYIHRR